MNNNVNNRVKTENRAEEYGKRNGEVFTPDSIVNDMLDLISNGLKQLEGTECFVDDIHPENSTYNKSKYCKNCEYCDQCPDNTDVNNCTEKKMYYKTDSAEKIAQQDYIQRRKRIVQNAIKKTFIDSGTIKGTDDNWFANAATTKSKDTGKLLYTVKYYNKDNQLVDMGLKELFDTLISETYFEPTCGNGNILINILMRKIAYIEIAYPENSIEKATAIIKAISSIYGVDINPYNVMQARERLLEIVIDGSVAVSDIDGQKEIQTISLRETLGSDDKKVIELIKHILECNIQYGNTLNKPIEDTDNNMLSNVICQDLVCSDIFDERQRVTNRKGKQVIDLLLKGLSKGTPEYKLAAENSSKCINIINEYSIKGYSGYIFEIKINKYILQEHTVDYVHYEPLEHQIGTEETFTHNAGNEFTEYMFEVPSRIDENSQMNLMDEFDF